MPTVTEAIIPVFTEGVKTAVTESPYPSLSVSNTLPKSSPKLGKPTPNGDANSPGVQAANPPANHVADNTDCNDGDSAVYPGATEILDGKDNDCDGTIDEGFQTSIWYPDNDNDGYGDANSPGVSDTSAPSGYVSDNTDCNDANSAINPGASEINDGIDNDCDGLIDEGFDNDTNGNTDTGTEDTSDSPTNTDDDTNTTPPEERRGTDTVNSPSLFGPSAIIAMFSLVTWVLLNRLKKLHN